ncbi:coenzyme A diphosphatase [Schizosaccharomyces japonicus yFS275]|uniref:Coenzyme A diphosphatase n=1 Tax=Schizosaccharomyces japonicus (strain yFS275 / FY16936) TaxID=402676 RepID=B6K1Y5_SCHJY|nr:coenzyme A diphosphatase [Schizosaccharomyces japonicus yFS275]EEB07166.1 coenzyme A diphosphatase [Schizosaccharomyces japonicus yFS275]
MSLIAQSVIPRFRLSQIPSFHTVQQCVFKRFLNTQLSTLSTAEDTNKSINNRLFKLGLVDEDGYFSRESLLFQKKALLNSSNSEIFKFPKYSPSRFASVLLPLVNSEEGAAVIVTLRSSRLHTHAGQMCFPGGKAEQSDGSWYNTALRETYEEIGLLPNFFQRIGSLPSLPTKDWKTKITPYISFTNQYLMYNVSEEVQQVYCIPLTFLLNPKNQRRGLFRNEVPFIEFHLECVPRIWGITAFILNSYFSILCPDLLMKV